MRKGIILLLCIFLVSMSFAAAATVHGSVYGSDLRKLEDVKIDINTVPEQTFISKDGGYSFEINPGTYTLTAKHYEGGYLKLESEEEIIIAEEGDFVIDLILFDVLDEEEILLQESDITIEDVGFEESKTWFYTLLIISIIIIITISLYLKTRTKKTKTEEPKEASADLEKVIQVIKENGNRITQKELRKKFPLSEAKISLMITELEHEGKLKKIKKGRGNVLILKD